MLVPVLGLLSAVSFIVVARPDEAARPRLHRVLTGLTEQLTEARSHDWAGEVERLLYIQGAVEDKIAELDRARRRNRTVALPMPLIKTHPASSTPPARQ